MLKNLLLAAALAVSTTFAASAPAQADPAAFVGPAVGLANNMFRAAGPRGQQRPRENGCAPGYHPAPGLGCIGETITDRRVIKAFDAPIARGCVQGATRVVKVPGVMPDGRRVTWTLRQHAECNNRGI